MGPIEACPFCGSTDAEVEQESLCFSVRCMDCDASASEFPTLTEAWAAWNRRPGDEVFSQCPDCKTAEHVECVGEGTSWQTNCFHCGNLVSETTTRKAAIAAWNEAADALAATEDPDGTD